MADGESAAERTKQGAATDPLGEALLLQARQWTDALATYLGSATPRSWLRDVDAIARQQPLLAVGGAFALGLLTARLMKSASALGASDAAGRERVAPVAQRDDSAARRDDSVAQSDVSNVPDGASAVHDVRAADSIGVGSPIADAPGASGSRLPGVG